MRIQVNDFIPRGEMFFVADVDHPELSFVDDIDAVDGTVVVCHPDDEEVVRDTIALVGEQRDVNEWAAAVRRRRARL